MVIIGRNEAKSQEAVMDIRRQTGNEKVDYLVADLSSISDTLAVAEAYRQQYDRLDVLVNNVGAIFFSRGESADGIENTFALNHLSGYFLLTQQLLDMIIASAPARIVNVSSNAHYPGSMHWDDIELHDDYSGMKAYAQSKLANVLFTYELARSLERENVTVNALHPGVIASNFGATNNRRLIQLGQKLFKVFLPGVDKGAETSVYLATSPEVEGVTGRYFEKMKPKTSSEASYAESDQNRLWQVSEEMLAEHSAYAKTTARGLPIRGRPMTISHENISVSSQNMFA